MFDHSTTLISRFFTSYLKQLWIGEIIFTLVFLTFLKNQWFFLNYFYDLELSLKVIKNYRIAAFVNL